MEGRGAGGGCDGGVPARHSTENRRNMTAWHDPASLTHCCPFSTALATRSVWLEQISSLTPALCNTRLFSLSLNQPEEFHPADYIRAQTWRISQRGIETHHVLPSPWPKCQGDAHSGIFSLSESENYFIREEDEESYLWFPPALGWLFLERASSPESFHKWSTLCSVKEN